MKLPKCKFIRKGTKYLEFIIDKGGIQPDVDKVEVNRAMPEPRTVKEVMRFIEVIVYYTRFILEFSRLATTLRALTKKKCSV